MKGWFFSSCSIKKQPYANDFGWLWIPKSPQIKVPPERVLSFDEKRQKSLIEPRFCKDRRRSHWTVEEQNITKPWIACRFEIHVVYHVLSKNSGNGMIPVTCSIWLLPNGLKAPTKGLLQDFVTVVFCVGTGFNTIPFMMFSHLCASCFSENEMGWFPNLGLYVSDESKSPTRFSSFHLKAY